MCLRDWGKDFKIKSMNYDSNSDYKQYGTMLIISLPKYG